MIQNPLCSQPKHERKNWKFCQLCANTQDQKYVFYCIQCSPQSKINHSNHPLKIIPMTSKANTKFLDKLNKFKQAFVKRLISDFNDIHGDQQHKDTNKMQILIDYFQEKKPVFLDLLINQLNLEIFQSFKFRCWILKTKFWLQQAAFPSILKDIDMNAIVPNLRESGIDSTFKVNWGTQDDSCIDPEKQLEKIDCDLNQLSYDNKILEFFIKLNKTFQCKSCTKMLAECDRLLKENPKAIMLYWAKMHLLQLLPSQSCSIKEVLKSVKEACPKIAQSYLYHYYDAISQWNIVDKKKISNKIRKTLSSPIFYESRNQKHHELNDAPLFILKMTKAIDSIGSNQKNACILYSSRGIGYLVNGQYDLAKKDFEEAKKTDDIIDSQEANYNYCKIKLNEYQNEENFQNELNTRETYFIINSAKYFKNIKKKKELIECLKILVERQPNNKDMRIQMIKAYLMGNSSQNIPQAADQIQKIQTLPIPIKVLRKFKYIKAKDAEEYCDFEGARMIYEELSQGNTSSTAWYNHAVTAFKEKNYEMSLKSVENALKLKNKPKYRKLKLYNYCYLKNWGYAKVTAEDFTGEENQKLKQFINSQLQD